MGFAALCLTGLRLRRSCRHVEDCKDSDPASRCSQNGGSSGREKSGQLGMRDKTSVD